MTDFNDLGLNTAILDVLIERGFEKPTPIQAEIIPFLLNGERDVTGLAQTGTGKTAAFALPILQKIDTGSRDTQALVLCPTRELCVQVSRDIKDFGRKIKGLKTTAVYGGTPFGPQIRELKAGVHIITATPGRLKDLLERGIADISSLKFLVLDEADQMLDMGFKEELDAILENSSPERQTLLFSATMPPAVARIAKNYMKDPHEIVAGEKNRGTNSVEHKYYRVHASNKFEALKRLIDFNPDMYGIVFCRTRETVKEISNRLAADGYLADSLHGELSQAQRDGVMRRFRNGTLSLLIATDVAARGLDVNNLTHVIHYDLPDEIAIYNHRSGRTGRAGRSGESLALVHLKEVHRIGRIEKVLGRKIKEEKIPTGKEIAEIRIANLVGQIKNIEINNSELDSFRTVLEEELKDFDKEELLARFISLEVNRYLAKYASAPDINPPTPPKRSRKEAEYVKGAGKNRYSGSMVRFRINLGRKHSVLPPQLIGLINQSTNTRNIRLGRIEISNDWSDIQVEKSMAEKVEASLNGFNYRGMKIRLNRLPDGRKNKKHSGHGDYKSGRKKSKWNR